MYELSIMDHISLNKKDRPRCYIKSPTAQGRYQLWQSRVEIEGYSVAYFDHIAAFEALYC